ncbi:MAG: outer membrane protein assembly factor BamA [Betaproteobacteria bacterium RIFCSPLOWO2_12_FULL_62_13b]|nr:MAG: outer membrane protein assembly factor BamA [Betaproteobacteria bacterium RIFCSPLOWO2_12_FULL_62_13b]
MIRHLVVALLCLWAGVAHAFDPFVVRDIRVEGIQRIEAGTVFSYLPVKVGETMTDEKAAAAIKALFATGFFKDVRLEVQRNVLIVMVEERPAVSQIDFIGNKEFDKDALRKGLREIGLAEGRSLDKALLDQAEQEIKRQYLARGRYGASVVTTVTPLERNRVGVSFSVTEGDVTKIREINIIGNRAFKEKDLLQLFVLQTPGWMTWYTKNDQYSKQKLSGDLETLRSHYLNNGYLEFNIESTQVSITPDKKDIYITINVAEGDKYTVSDVNLGGEMLLPEAELRRLIQLKPGETFSREKLSESTKKITDRLGNEGYAFANANAVPELDKAAKRVALTIMIDPGRRVYVRRINISGNSRTRDEVVRREMRQLEGAYYDGDKIQKSKQRLQRLEYFSEVDVDTPAVPGASDQVDVDFKVKEKPTGAIMLGGGFSSTEKVILSGSITQQNIFGSGKYVSLQLNTSKINRNIGLSYTDPYYTVDGVSRGFDVYDRRTDAALLGLGYYTTTTIGGGVRFGMPLTEIDNLGFGVGAENTKLGVDQTSPQRYQDFVNIFGNNNNSIPGTIGWIRDQRDSAITPTRGSLVRANLEAGLPGGTLKFYKLTEQVQWYYPISRTYTLALNGEIGAADGMGGKPLPFYKNYYAGGASSVRGFNSYSLGPRDSLGAILGGNKRLVGNAEVLFPVPGTGVDRSMRLGLFLDTGQVFGADEKMRLSELRYSTGISFNWNSPMGPLRLSYGLPLNAKPVDNKQHIQFQLGQIF